MKILTGQKGESLLDVAVSVVAKSGVYVRSVSLLHHFNALLHHFNALLHHFKASDHNLLPRYIVVILLPLSFHTSHSPLLTHHAHPSPHITLTTLHTLSGIQCDQLSPQLLVE